MSENIVGKIGGTSMTRPEQVANVVMDHDNMHTVIVSAPGGEIGVRRVTKMLDDYTGAVYREDTASAQTFRDEVVGRFEALYSPYIGSDARKLITANLAKGLEVRPGLSKQEARAHYASQGETASEQYFATMIGAPSVGARCIRFTTDGQLDRSATRWEIARRAHKGIFVTGKVVMGGFHGFDINGKRHLLDDGGSDRTGAIISEGLERVVGGPVIYQNWTDVDGIYRADPRIVPAAKVIPELSRREVREGAHSGTEVLQGDTILDLDGSSVVTILKNTFNPKAAGTRVVPRRVPADSESIASISGRDDLTLVTVHDMGMANRPGYMAAREEYLGKHNMDVKRHADSEDSFSFITIAKTPEQEAAIQGFCDYTESQIVAASGSVAIAKKGMVSIVGEGLQDPNKRNAAQIRILGEIAARHRNLTIEDTLTSPGSPSMSFVVPPQDVEPIVQAIHSREFERNTR
jgi:aspartate kinase